VFAQGGVLEQFDSPAAILGAPATQFVADFVGADRGLKRLSVTPVSLDDLEHPPVVRLDDDMAVAATAMGASSWAVVLDADGGLAGWIGQDMTTGAGTVREHARRMEAWVELDDSLKVAFGEMLQWNAGWIAVLDERERYLGVLTPSTLHAALRRSVEADVQQIEAAEVQLETVQDA
jgi:osmoprotectant transport system ATP-binding protein